MFRGNREYLVRWKGYTAAEDTWETEENVRELDALKEFLSRYPDPPAAPRRRGRPPKSKAKPKTKKRAKTRRS